MSKKLRILTIEKKNDLSILKKESGDISDSEIKSSEFQKFLDDLIYTAKNHVMDEGWMTAGLAAVQVGKNTNVFVVLNNEINQFEEYINPKLEYIGDIQEKEIEGCLSLPGKQGNVSRYRKVKISYKNRLGEKKVKKVDNYTAKVIQHEYDHLQGILFTDKLSL